MGTCNSQILFNDELAESNGGHCTAGKVGSDESERIPDGSTQLEVVYHSHVPCDQPNVKSTYNCFNRRTTNNLSAQNSITDAFKVENLLTVYDLYNIFHDIGKKPYIHNPENILIVDARDFECFSKGHVVTAKHYKTIMANRKSRKSLAACVEIIAYGGQIKNDKPTKTFLQLISRIEENIGSDILVLKDGFHMLEKRFPFLCTEQDIWSTSDRKRILCYPSVIIDDFLYQGRGNQATNEVIIDNLGITHIVNISEHQNAFPNEIKYLNLPLEDLKTTNLLSHFHETSDFIDDALSINGRVLVHCNLGISRSSSITLAYLMKHKRWKLEYAFRFLKSRRTCASPNSGFLKQLSDWEGEMFGLKHTDINATFFKQSVGITD